MGAEGGRKERDVEQWRASKWEKEKRGGRESLVNISLSYYSNSASYVYGCVILEKSLNLSELPFAWMAIPPTCKFE